jgi:hypothetical protein
MPRKLNVCFVASAVLFVSLHGCMGDPVHSVRVHEDTVAIFATEPLHVAQGEVIEEARIAGAGGSDSPALSTVVTVWTGPDGSLYLVDHSGSAGRPQRSVHKYSHLGKYIGRVGRIGDGPGEYRAPGDVRELRDGRILVMDARAVLIYARDMSFLDQVRLGPNGSNTGGRMFVDSAGYIYAHTTVGSPVSRVDGKLVLNRNNAAFIRLRSDGVILDTVPFVPDGVGEQDLRPASHAPFVPRIMYAHSSLGYFVTARSDSYAVDLRIAPPGRQPAPYAWRLSDPVRSLRRTVHAPALSQEERHDWIESITGSMRVESPGWEWSGPPVPAFKPVIAAIQVAEDGRIWIRLHQPSVRSGLRENDSLATRTHSVSDVYERWREPAVYDIWEPRGVYVGQVRLPDGVRQMSIRDSIIWAMFKDTDDAPYLIKFRLHWPS